MTGKGDVSRELKAEGYTVRVFREGDEVGLAALFASTAFQNPVAEWVWKYKNSPYYDSSLIVAAEKGGEIAGGIHAQTRILKIGESLIIDASVGSGLMVKSEHRRRGVATEMIRLLRGNLRKRGVILHYSAPESWAYQRVYSKRDALMVGEKMHHNARYYKRLIKNVVARKITSINTVLERNPSLRSRLEGLSLSIKFNITGCPSSTFVLAIYDGRFVLKEVDSTEPDIGITCKDFTSSPPTLLKMLLLRRVKTRGWIANGLKLFRCLRVLREISQLKTEAID